MDEKHKWKIDLRDSFYGFNVGLYVKQRCWHTRITGLVYWKWVGSYKTKEQAAKAHAQLKDLPEYL